MRSLCHCPEAGPYALGTNIYVLFLQSSGSAASFCVVFSFAW